MPNPVPNPAAPNRPDFVMVQLTDAGKKLAGGGSLRISNGRRTLEFFPDKPIEVEKSYEWRAWLSRHTHSNGAALFELVPPANASAAPPPDAAPENVKK